MGSWQAETISTRRLGPRLVRIVLGGPGLSCYATNAIPDESVTLYFPRPGEHRPPAMTLVGEAWGYHDVTDSPTGRNYTVRDVDRVAGTVTIDFVLHGDGIASQWAATARPGDGLVLWRQRGWYHPPQGATGWIVLAADLTGVPAVLRILEKTPPGIPVTVLVDAIDEDDVDELIALAPEGARIDVRFGAGNGHAPGTLLERIAALSPPPGPGYAWFAGEAGDARRARQLWREQHGLARERIAAVGYWRSDLANWEKRHAQVHDEMERLYAEAINAGASISEAGELVDAELHRRGL